MNHARFTFLGDLEYFLQPKWRQQVTDYVFHPHQTVKHLVEAAGVPHTEIAQIRANGRVVTMDYRVRDGDQVIVYPHNWLIPGGEDADTPPSDHPASGFLLDNHLGKLATYLRMLGFDSMYSNDYQDEKLAELAAQTGRILLTRDRRLLMRCEVAQGYCLRSTSSTRQVKEVLDRFHLYSQIKPFCRCLRCNGLLQPVSKEAIIDRLQPLTRLYYDDFNICPACDQIYWRGSHQQRMQKFIQRLSG